jgi:hypothetical protein
VEDGKQREAQGVDNLDLIEAKTVLEQLSV